MKHKGQGISINGNPGQSNLDAWKRRLAKASEGLPVREFVPLKVAEHPRAAEMRAYADIPSRFA